MQRLSTIICALAVLASPFAHATVKNNPYLPKGENVTPVLHSSIVGDIVIASENAGNWKFSASIDRKDAAEVLHITMDAPEPCSPAPFVVQFIFPQGSAFNFWTPDSNCKTHLDPYWGVTNNVSSLAVKMPLYQYFDDNNTNCLTVACSETFRRVETAMGLLEEGCNICSEFRFFKDAQAPSTHYETSIRLDSSERFWSDCIEDASQWMMDVNGFMMFPAPEQAFEPLYSSWYQFHQGVSDEAVRKECGLAASYGMKTIILDDGWQTDDGQRGYAFCGDWKPSKAKFPDMAAHVKAVHQLGMKYMVWFSVPFVGWNSEAYSKFEGKYLYIDNGNHCGVLDPRFPEVRTYLINTYVNALKDWDIDGFKLDFIDSFGLRGEDPAVKDNYAGRDIMNVNEAVNVLMKDVSSRLNEIKPGILLEFRQQYIGPAIRQYGNMLRAADCPGNAKDNRMRIASLRLTSGSTAVHSDMLEWNLEDSSENVARAIINSIFGVIQYSAMLKDISAEHQQTIRKWMDFAARHKNTLLKGKLRPYHPELGYPVIGAEGEDEVIIAVYQDNALIDVPEGNKAVYILNASGKDDVTICVKGKLLRKTIHTGDWLKL